MEILIPVYWTEDNKKVLIDEGSIREEFESKLQRVLDNPQLAKSESQETKICPLCGVRYNEWPALSRVLKGVDICPNCGTREAFVPQTEKGFIDLWSTARRLPEGALEQIKEHFVVR